MERVRIAGVEAEVARSFERDGIAFAGSQSAGELLDAAGAALRPAKGC